MKIIPCGGCEDAGGPRRDRAAGDGISEGSKGPGKLKNTLLEINRLAANFFYYQLKQPSGKIGYDYLKEKRRLSDDTIRHFLTWIFQQSAG